MQFKQGELIKFRKRGGQKLLSKHVQRVKKTFRAPESFFVAIRVEKNRKLRVHSDPVKKKLSGARKFFYIVISVSALWWHAAAEQALRHKSCHLMAAVKVVLQPRLGWPWQFEDGRLSTTFGEILDAYAPQNAYGWHSSCYSLWVGDQLVRRDMALSDVTNGSIGLVVCTLHTPDDTAAQKVAKSLALLQKQVPGDVTKDLFFQPLGCCSTF